jgi:hypothetical protein
LLLPQFEQASSAEVDGDDEELASRGDLRNDFAGGSVERIALDDALDFLGFPITLSFDDLAREDDVLEIED